MKPTVSAQVLERHGYLVTVRLAVTAPPGAQLDLPDLPYLMRAAGHAVAAELWRLALPLGARWAVDVSYGQVAIELTEGEPVHVAVLAAERACRAAGVSLGASARLRPPARTKGARAVAPKKRARG